MSASASITTQPLRLTEMPAPEIAADEVRIRVSACAICRTDLRVVEGELSARRSPVIPGHQVVGRVTELGAHVTELSLGQRVGVTWLHHLRPRLRAVKRPGHHCLCKVVTNVVPESVSRTVSVVPETQ